MTEQSKIVFLGTGTPNADPDRSGPSVAIIAGGKPYIVDCGPGVVRRASAALRNGISELDINNLDTLFITHLHSDHTAGLPDFVLTPWVLGRENPLRVFGPPGIKAMTDEILSAYSIDISERLYGLQPSNKDGIEVTATQIEEGLVYLDENIRVIAFRVLHGSLDAYGYRFHTPDRVITISGDTYPFPELEEHYKDSEVLIHEVYSTAGFEKYPPEWRDYHSRVHTSSSELAAIAKKVKPGLLILYHQLFNGVSEDNLIYEVYRDYPGKIVSAKDLDVY
ncbi:MAG TPA: MBL fold metallo-hydrolase [bacterium]|jgi:ribonuclease BN (tRNA processing enzyme)